MLKVCGRYCLKKTFSNQNAVPRIEVSPRVALVDEKICVRAVKLQPSQEVTLQAWVSERGTVYTSCGQFVADGQGCVDTTQHSSLAGSYTGIDAMGLFWSLKVVQSLSKTTRLTKADVTTPLLFDIRVVGGHVGFDNLPHTSDSVLASTTCERWYKHQSVRRVVVRDGKLRGTLFIPPGSGPFPGVLDMFGTRTGLAESRASLLASRGFAVFALAYYHFDDLPKTLNGLDIRYLMDAVDWLTCHPSVRPGGIGAVGSSKGGELAFALGSITDKVTAIVNVSGAPMLSFDDLLKDGKTFIKGLGFDASRIKHSEDGVLIENCFPLHKRQIIEAWTHNARILFLCGDNDGLWDTRKLTKVFYLLIPDEYKRNVQIVNYTGAGHHIDPPYMPVVRTSYFKMLGMNLCWGGYPKPHAVAQEDAWRRLLTFLHDNLDQTKPSRL